MFAYTRSCFIAMAALSLAVSPLCASGAQAASGTLEKIKSSGTFTIGYRDASVPFSYLGPDQKPIGLSIQLCSDIADRIKASLNMPSLRIEYVAVNGSNRIPLLQNGTVDIECGSTTNTSDRRKQVDFSVPTFVTTPRWLVLASSPIQDIKDLKNKTVVVTQGSADLPIATKVIASEGMSAQITQPKDHAESILMLRTQRAAAWFDDDIVLAGLAALSSDPKAFRFLPATYEAAYYGLMLRKGDDEFKTLVNDTLRAQMASGQFEKLYKKWFETPIPPNGQNLLLPMSAAMQRSVKFPDESVIP